MHINMQKIPLRNRLQLLIRVRPATTKYRKNARNKQASFRSKFKVDLMVVDIIWHRFEKHDSKRNLMFYAMHTNIQKIPLQKKLQS